MRDVDRAVRVCDRLRPVLPLLLAHQRQLALPRRRATPGCTPRARRPSRRRFPRCGIPDAYGSWAAYRDYIEFLIRTELDRRVHAGVVVGPPALRRSGRSRCASATRRPPRPSPRRSAALIVACVAQAARDDDEGVPFADPPRRLIEENFWRAIRYGMDGDADRPRPRRGVPGRRGGRAAAAVDRAGARRAGHRRRASRRSTAPSASAARSTRVPACRRSSPPPCARPVRPTSRRPRPHERAAAARPVQGAHRGGAARRLRGSSSSRSASRTSSSRRVVSLHQPRRACAPGLVPGNEGERDPAAAARGDRGRARAAAAGRAGARARRRARSATRCRSCRWPTRARRAPAAQAARRRRPRRRRREAAPQGAPQPPSPDEPGPGAEQRPALGSGALTPGARRLRRRPR